MAEGKVDKAGALYLYRKNCNYLCEECKVFIPELKRCVFHGKDDVIRAKGTCGLFVRGTPVPGCVPLGMVDKRESGYVEPTNGVTCKRCEYFDAVERDCEKVDRDSPGDNPGIIHPDACCNNWEEDD